MQKLNLPKRPADIGGSINTRTEMHGKDKVPAHDIMIATTIVGPEETGALTGTDDAYDRLYREENGLIVPAFPYFAPQRFAVKFQGAKVRVWLQSGDEVDFEDASLKDVTLFLATGGNSGLVYKLQVTDADRQHLDIAGLLNSKVHIQVKSAELIAKEMNPELPLDHGNKSPEDIAAAEEEERKATREATGSPDIDETLSRTGRKIQRAARKRK